MSIRVLIFGNAGSGKTTLAQRLSSKHGIPVLNLDSIVWSADEFAVVRPESEILSELMVFVRSNTSWIVEGCYGRVMECLQTECTEMIFMNPGRAVCVHNCMARPWEPLKYANQAEQDDKLPFLLSWVAEYYYRTDDMSLRAHRHLYDSFAGRKREITNNEPEAIGEGRPREILEDE